MGGFPMMGGMPTNGGFNPSMQGNGGFSPPGMPMVLDCEMIHTSKRCMSQPRCSWILDDSLWACIETKEVETSKQFWAITKMNQGRMPGPIPGTHGIFGGGMVPPDDRPQPPRMPSNPGSGGSDIPPSNSPPVGDAPV